MQTKGAIVLQKLSEFSLETQYPQEKREKLRDGFERDDYWFEPFSYKTQIDKVLDLIDPISTNTIGEKIKQISTKKWYR